MRGEGSILDAIKQPDLAAEITLQPVRRYGVDAAVLYSDIVVPAARRRVRHRRGPRHRPGGRAAVPHRRRPRPAARRSSPTTHAVRASTRSHPGRRAAADVPLLAFAGAPFTVASYLVEGRPSRDLPAHQGAHAHRPAAVAPADGAARRSTAVAFIDAQLSTAPAPSSCSTRGPERCRRADYRRFVLPHSQPRVRRARARHPGVPGIHFGIGCDHLLEAMHDGRARTVIGARLAHPDRRRPPPARRRPRWCRATSTRPSCSPAGRGRRWPAPNGCWPTTPATPATSSTSATACSPTPTPTCSTPSVAHVHG